MRSLSAPKAPLEMLWGDPVPMHLSSPASVLHPTSLCLRLLFPSEMAVLPLFPLSHSLFMHHREWVPASSKPPSPLESPAHLCISSAHSLGLSGSQNLNVYVLSP